MMQQDFCAFLAGKFTQSYNARRSIRFSYSSVNAKTTSGYDSGWFSPLSTDRGQLNLA